MSKKPDPGTSLDTSKLDAKAAREAVKAARLAAWKRETTKTQREKAKKDRSTGWEEVTGLKYEVPKWAV